MRQHRDPARDPSLTKTLAYDLKGETGPISDPLGYITTLASNPVGLISSITDA